MFQLNTSSKARESKVILEGQFCYDEIKPIKRRYVIKFKAKIRSDGNKR